MPENKPKLAGHYRCPECFKKEKDIWLKYDENDKEYYCIKCCFVESSTEKLDAAFAAIRRDKFKL